VIIACLDVDYRATGARAACVVIDGWNAVDPIAKYTRDISDVQPYEPGNFYRRELPCLLSLLEIVQEKPDVVVIDGYVWLASQNRAGLGAHLHAAIGHCIPIVGVAKSLFLGADSSTVVVAVERGASRSPLYVTSVGVDPKVAAIWVQSMAGQGRIPKVLRAVDQLARSK